jgi:hypothetical protein
MWRPWKRKSSLKIIRSAFGRPDGDLLPMYGCHWNPGPFRDLEVWDSKTGQTTTRAKIAEVEAKYGEWLAKEFAGKPCSIFFPVISPDLKRVFFKIAAGNGGDDFMAKNASHRQGLVCYDFEKSACIWQHGKWGHPGWTPDSQHIFEMGNVIFDIHTGKYTKLKDVPVLRGSHPSVSPDGKLMVTDGLTEPVGGKAERLGHPGGRHEWWEVGGAAPASSKIAARAPGGGMIRIPSSARTESASTTTRATVSSRG